MDYHGINMVGPLIVERVDTLPSHSIEDLGRVVFLTTNNTLYICSDSQYDAINGGTGSGVTDHGLLQGLDDDDHSQYLTRTDASTDYVTISSTAHDEITPVPGNGLLDDRYYTEPEVDTAIAVVQSSVNSLGDDLLNNYYTKTQLEPVSGAGALDDRFVLLSSVGQVNGVAQLDGGGKLPQSIIPQIALTDVNVVADQTARDALTVQEGDVAVQTDNSTSYIYDGAAWQVLGAPGGGGGDTATFDVVTSVSIVGDNLTATKRQIVVTNGLIQSTNVTTSDTIPLEDC